MWAEPPPTSAHRNTHLPRRKPGAEVSRHRTPHHHTAERDARIRLAETEDGERACANTPTGTHTREAAHYATREASDRTRPSNVAPNSNLLRALLSLSLSLTLSLYLYLYLTLSASRMLFVLSGASDFDYFFDAFINCVDVFVSSADRNVYFYYSGQ